MRPLRGVLHPFLLPILLLAVGAVHAGPATLTRTAIRDEPARAPEPDRHRHVREELAYRFLWDESLRAWVAENPGMSARVVIGVDGLELRTHVETDPPLLAFSLGGSDVAPSAGRVRAAGREVVLDHGDAEEVFENSPGGLRHVLRLRHISEPSQFRWTLGGSLAGRLDRTRNAASWSRRDGVRHFESLVLSATERGRHPLTALLEMGLDSLSVALQEEGVRFPLELELLHAVPGQSFPIPADAVPVSILAAGDFDDDGLSDLVYAGKTGWEIAPGSPSAPARSWSPNELAGRKDFRPSAATGDFDGDDYDDLALGDPFYACDGACGGRVLVFYGGPEGLSEEPGSVILGRQPGSAFGYSVAFVGDRTWNERFDNEFIVGAPLEDHPEVDEGVVYVFRGTARGITLRDAVQVAESNVPSAQLGFSVGGGGSLDESMAHAIAGAPGYPPPDPALPWGRVLYLAGEKWVTPWTDDGPFPDVELGAFGYAVAIVGVMGGGPFEATVAVGAPCSSWRPEPGVLLGSAACRTKGSVILYAGYDDHRPARIFPDLPAGSLLGLTVSTAGDTNGDDFADMLVGAPGFRASSRSGPEGAVFMVEGGTGFTLHTATITWKGRPGERLGDRLGPAGDLDGDGLSDLFVNTHVHHGAPPVPDPRLSATRHWPLGETDLLMVGELQGDGSDDLILPSRYPARRFVGDVDGDGRSDTIAETAEGLSFEHLDLEEGWQGTSWVSAPLDSIHPLRDVTGDGFADIAVVTPSGIDLHQGGPAGPSIRPYSTLPSVEPPVVPIGDVNGDGVGDFLTGGLRLHYGAALGPPPAVDWCGVAHVDPSRAAGAPAGDFNGDGFDDVLLFSRQPAAEGRILLFLGSAIGLASTPAWTLRGDAAVHAGDHNTDGLSDVLVRQQVTSGFDVVTRSSLYLGKTTGVDPEPLWTVEKTHSVAALESVYPLVEGGDFNGDGASDVFLVNGVENTFTIVHGLTELRQGQTGGAWQIGPELGQYDVRMRRGARTLSHLPDSITLATKAYSAASGPGWVRMEWEIKPADTPFDGRSIQRGAWVRAPGQPDDDPLKDIIQDVTMLSPGTGYHWRVRVGSTSPALPHGKWWSPPGVGRETLHIRTRGLASFQAAAPRDGARLSTDAGAPLFSWYPSNEARFLMQWSSTDTFSGRVETSESIEGRSTYRPGPELWARILSLSREGRLYWRVLAESTPGTVTEARVLRVEADRR